MRTNERSMPDGWRRHARLLHWTMSGIVVTTRSFAVAFGALSGAMYRTDVRSLKAAALMAASLCA
ncbi:hypothetical protein WT59_29080 [Burkholderia territorii]|nr:hypothetical protein WT59_29080 [Burkholderia territorii]